MVETYMTAAPQDPTAELMAEICKEFDWHCDHAKIRRLIDAGARLDATDEDGETPLQQCVSWAKDADTVRMLIEAGSPLEHKNNNQLTALTYAAWHGRREIALALIEAGADPNGKNKDGTSALLLAMNGWHHEVAEALILKGADVDAPGFSDKLTPLLAAVINFQDDLAVMLLERGCNIDAVRENEFRDTALSLADKTNKPLASIIRLELSERALAAHRSAVVGMGVDMHAGAEQPVAVVRTLRFKTPARSYLRL